MEPTPPNTETRADADDAPKKLRDKNRESTRSTQLQLLKAHPGPHNINCSKHHRQQGKQREQGDGVGAEAIVDAVVTNTPVFVRFSASTSSLSGSLVLNNVKLNNVSTAVGIIDGTTVLTGGTTMIDTWVQGNVYTGTDPVGKFVQGYTTSIPKAPSLLDNSGRIFGKTRPTYADYAVSQFVSVKSYGATGDGNTDDTAALQSVFDNFAGCKIIYFDAGTYIVSSTLTIPAGTQIVGEAWSSIMGSGSAFTNQNNPQVVVRVGTSGSTGVAEISSLLFTTRAPANGAIVVEWNVHEPAGQQGATGMWDSLFRLGGAAGTNMQADACASTIPDTGDNCFAEFLGLHLTSGSSAYLEGTWVWLTDHDVDGGGTQTTVYGGRGILSESQGPVWMIGTAEHHVLYEYNLAGASDHYMGLIQTETPYFQPDPSAPAPFISSAAYHDPVFNSSTDAWALYVQHSNNILVFGAGLYSFYQDYVTNCEDTGDCQMRILNVDSSSSASIFSLSTVDSVYQIDVDENGIVSASANPNGFADTVTVWTLS
ncbi:pectin lyase-like protein [Artomyces pyxidatus]|uniref:Pectin lyase-like protein n=1 Tax=Artomyces pyxidatus TaxID=48021 RepID=A0ACB8T430_9AGAM|nr:pectin lyase-like protein [Artomyces pyxidatus]